MAVLDPEKYKHLRMLEDLDGPSLESENFAFPHQVRLTSTHRARLRIITEHDHASYGKAYIYGAVLLHLSLPQQRETSTMFA